MPFRKPCDQVLSSLSQLKRVLHLKITVTSQSELCRVRSLKLHTRVRAVSCADHGNRSRCPREAVLGVEWFKQSIGFLRCQSSTVSRIISSALYSFLETILFIIAVDQLKILTCSDITFLTLAKALQTMEKICLLTTLTADTGFTIFFWLNPIFISFYTKDFYV